MLCLTCVAVALLPFSSGSAPTLQTIHFTDPIDAISIAMQGDAAAEVRAKTGESWTDWQTLTIDNEQDPSLRESNLVMFDVPVSDIEFRGDVPAPAVHPIRVSHAPVQYKVAAATLMSTPPRILLRDDWGADKNLLYTDAKFTIPVANAQEVLPTPSTGSAAPSQRDIDCKEAQTNYPDEFKTINTVSKENGKTLRWEHTYSKKIKELVVHHTAVQVTGDTRSGAERVRALYQYHSVNRGWGDIGYHYIVDEQGQIYEGKEGGPFVVAGHAYCNNVGTIGIALLGNFELEQPSQAQIQSLQWLLKDLATQYDIDLTKSTTFHGKTKPPIIGHRDLLDTDCPGYYAYGLLDQVRANVKAGTVDAKVTLMPLRAPLPTVPVKSTSSRPSTVTAPPEEAAEDSTGQPPDRVARLQRKIRTAVRLSSRLGGRASQLATVRNTTSPVQTIKALPGRPTATYNPNQPTAPIQRMASSRSSVATVATNTQQSSTTTIKIHLESRDQGLPSCAAAPLDTLADLYRGTVTCQVYNGKPVIINTVSLEDYMQGLGEEPDTELYEKQRAFAIAARTYAAYYMLPENRKFPGAPYDGSDSPANFQKYLGKSFEPKNPRWVQAVTSTASAVLKKNNALIKPPYFSSDTGTTRSPSEAGWKNFPFSEIFTAKADPWCKGMPLNGHGVGMSGCGAKGQAKDGRTGEEILAYYYPGTTISYEK